ncbi:MAG: hypothetical protein ACD_63C00070G0008 [uncultured bacterium]|nr:MAG: hypothetical protein ACD_63C00070G0008 [uncultured bacterium]
MAKSQSIVIPIIVVAVIVSAVAAAVYFSIGEEDKDKTDYSGISALTIPVNDQDWKRGADNPKLTIVVYSDYQCPACVYAEKNIFKKLLEEYPKDLRVVMRQYPIKNLHPTAQKVAEASEAAGAQGKFWEMHEKLFESTSELKDIEKVKEIAKEIGLNMEKFEKELKDGTYTDKVEEDLNSGKKSGVTGTPTFYLNGEKYAGKISYDDVKVEVLKRLN